MSDFWARRKAAVSAEEAAEIAAVAEAEATPDAADLDGLSDAEILEQLDLPDPDALELGDDFKFFWSKAVPARIRTRALRRLWRVNPVLANVDGLVDYGEDFTDAALVVEGMETAYQVGKGMTAHVEELARQAAEKEAEDAGPAPEGEADIVDGAEDDPAELHEPAIPPEEPISTAAAPAMDADDDLPPAPMGRMRFRFDAPVEPVGT